MNDWERNRQMAPRIREQYPPGTRLELLSMEDPWSPISPGTRGTVQLVDDQAQIHMSWDNGRSLALVPGEDSFRKLTEAEIAAEQDTGIEEEDTGPVMRM